LAAVPEISIVEVNLNNAPIMGARLNLGARLNQSDTLPVEPTVPEMTVPWWKIDAGDGAEYDYLLHVCLMDIR